MDKFFLLVTTLIPMAAIAHPGHSHGTHLLMHYFEGSHLVFGVVAFAALALACRMIKRFFVE